MLPTSSLRLAINGAGTLRRSSQPRQSRVYRHIAKVDVDEMRKDKNTGEMAHSHLAGKEIRVICNLNFV